MILVAFSYKFFTKDKDAITSKFSTKQILASDLNSNLPLIQQAIVNAGFHKIGFDITENRFFATSGFSMQSWSEFIEVKVIEKNMTTELNLKSICAFPMQLFDWGKNKENYRKFEKELSKLITGFTGKNSAFV